jgi:hypothetical protein
MKNFASTVILVPSYPPRTTTPPPPSQKALRPNEAISTHSLCAKNP